jgi:hypothetical protein
MAMAIGVYFNFEGTTLDQYDEASRRLNNGQPLTALSQWPGGGCLSHTAWHEESGALGVFDVWESPEAFERFGQTLMPILGEVGIPQAEPHIVPLHNFVSS